MFDLAPVGASNPTRAANRPIRLAFVNSIYVEHDAISSTLKDRIRYAASAPNRFWYKLYCYNSSFSDHNVEIVSNPGDVLRSPEYQAADVLCMEFGIFHELFDLVLSARPAVKLVSYHNSTPARLSVNRSQRDLMERSELQTWNLAFADFVVCNSEFTRRQAIGFGARPDRSEAIAPSIAVIGTAPHAKPGGSLVNLLYVGRIVPQKGLLDLVEALALVRLRSRVPFCLSLVGALRFSDRDYLAQVQATIAAHHLFRKSAGWANSTMRRCAANTSVRMWW